MYWWRVASLGRADAVGLRIRKQIHEAEPHRSAYLRLNIGFDPHERTNKLRLAVLGGYAPAAKCAKGINLLLKALKEIISTGNFAAVAISMRHLLCSSSLVM